MKRWDFDFRKFPLWRKVIFVVGIGLFFILGSVSSTREMSTYAAAPRNPEPATGHICPVHTKYGYVLYLGAKEEADLAFWSPLVGLPLIPALLAFATSREFWDSLRAL